MHGGFVERLKLKVLRGFKEVSIENGGEMQRRRFQECFAGD
jgi:hypothetical protein